MNNRLLLSDLAGILAEKTGRERKDAEDFLREFLSVVSEGVIADKILKIKDIGTFKIIEVEGRESVHVNTGERIIIPGHYKLTFTPDKSLKELVNKPFSIFETVEVIDEPAQPETEATVATEATIATEEIKIPEKKKTPRWLIGILSFIAIIASIALIIYLVAFLPESRQDDNTTKEEIVANTEEIDTVEESASTVYPEEEEEKTLPAEKKDDVIALVTIESGTTLTKIALEHYGHKFFWVYIYDYNKDSISNPNSIPIGTKIKVPRADLYGIERTREAIDKAAAIQAEIAAGTH